MRLSVARVSTDDLARGRFSFLEATGLDQRARLTQHRLHTARRRPLCRNTQSQAKQKKTAKYDHSEILDHERGFFAALCVFSAVSALKEFFQTQRSKRYSESRREVLEDELEGELHLPAPLFVYVASEIARVVDVAIRRGTIHAVQHVVRREPELNIERLANPADREILEERRIPVKLRSPAENVATKRADVRTVRIARKDPRLRTTERSAIQFESLVLLSLGRIRIPKQIHATAVARNIEHWSSLPGHDVVELPTSDHGVQTAIHIGAAKTPASAKRQIPNVRERKPVPDVSICIAAIELRPRRIVGTAITRTRAVVADATRRIVDRVRPRVRTQQRESFDESFLQFGLQRVVARAAGVSSRGDRTNTEDLTRSWSTFIIPGADVAQHQQVPAKRPDVSSFSEPVAPELPLRRQIVLVIHLILAVRVVEEDETPGCRRRETRARSGDRERRRGNAVIKRIAMLKH